jgi:hypothetical protein
MKHILSSFSALFFGLALVACGSKATPHAPDGGGGAAALDGSSSIAGHSAGNMSVADGSVVDSSVLTDSSVLADSSVLSDGATPDGSLFTDASDASDGGQCCPISPHPGCCMDFGGLAAFGCGTACDGMPLPDANWQRGMDSNGCPIWIQPAQRYVGDCCGCVVADGSVGDADGGFPPDASSLGDGG